MIFKNLEVTASHLDYALKHIHSLTIEKKKKSHSNGVLVAVEWKVLGKEMPA